MRPALGQIWVVELDPVSANEQAGRRPCVVVSGAGYNGLPIRHAFVSPLTSRDRGLPHHVPVGAQSGLRLASFAMPEYTRAVSTTRFGRQVGAVSPETLASIRRWIQLFIEY